MLDLNYLCPNEIICMDNILKVRTVHDYNAFVEQADLHPSVSVIEYALLPPIFHRRCQFSTYGLFLRDDHLEELTYGYNSYDYKEGSLMCVAPGQIAGVEYNGNRFAIEGWALLFHPDIIHGTPLESQMNGYTYFSYQVNEALHMTKEERETFISLLKQIRHEMEHGADIYQDSIIVSYIELILKQCKYFYDRQFATRKIVNDDILARFEKFLNDYFNSGRLATDGVPTVAYCAQELCLSPNYFSDLVKKGTGESPINYIRRAIVNLVKSKLINGHSVKEISYEIGFDYPQHLSRMFKNYTGESPQEFYNRNKKK